jgi:threonine dehydratase
VTISPDEITAAGRRLRNVARRTPLVPLDGAPEGAPAVWLKLENLQPGGSYKIRGLYNRMARVAPELKERGAVTISRGNAAIAAAYAARMLGVSLDVIMYTDSPRAKVEGVQRYGGRVRQFPEEYINDYLTNERWRAESRFFVHPFDHPDIWAGTGTCGLEVLEDLPGVRTVLVPIGGGGLVAGVTLAIKALAPHVRVLGVQAAARAPWPEALRRGELYRIPDPKPTIADGIPLPMTFKGTFFAVKDLLDGCLTVEEDEIRSAIRLLALQAKVVAEGAGAAATAAALRLAPEEGPVVAIVSGGNIDAPLLSAVLSEA